MCSFHPTLHKISTEHGKAHLISNSSNGGWGSSSEVPSPPPFPPPGTSSMALPQGNVSFLCSLCSVSSLLPTQMILHGKQTHGKPTNGSTQRSHVGDRKASTPPCRVPRKRQRGVSGVTPGARQGLTHRGHMTRSGAFRLFSCLGGSLESLIRWCEKAFFKVCSCPETGETVPVGKSAADEKTRAWLAEEQSQGCIMT